jgi:hypothetical protein
MTNPHRFILQPYKSPASRFRCPECQHTRRTFKRYIDTETDEYLADHVGRCDRADKCGYHYTPRQYFAENPNDVQARRERVSYTAPVSNKFNHLPAYLVTDSMIQKAYIHNNFILFLADIFGWEWALQAAERYNIGTSKYWHGATVFWQVDTKNRVRTGKVMLYDQATGKRVKEPFNHIAWVHKLLMRNAECQMRNDTGNKTSEIETPKSEFKLRQCFFGEHLLKEDTKKMVGITESEKTAVMASIMMPDLIWLAAGSLHGLTEEKWQVLKDRTVLLFPDVGAYVYWVQCARTLNLKMPATTFAVNDDMERSATDEERANGADMGDRWSAEWQEMTGFKSGSSINQ